MSQYQQTQKRQRTGAESPHTSRPGSHGHGFGNPQLASPSRSMPSSTSKADGSKKTSSSRTPAEIAVHQRNWGVLVDDAAFDKYPNFQDLVKGIVQPERLSAGTISPNTQELEQNQFREVYGEVKDFEYAFLDQVLPFLIHDGFTPSEESECIISAQQESNLLKKCRGYTWTWFKMKSWRGQGLSWLGSKTFRWKLGVPAGVQGTRLLLMRHSDSSEVRGFTVPSPDRIYYYNPRHFDYTVPAGCILSPDTLDLLNSYCGGIHPIFTIEGKSAGGDMTQMQNQAKNNSATTIEIERELYYLAGFTNDFRPKEDNGESTMTSCPDYNTFFFTATISSEVFKVYVAWAEVFVDGTVKKHINQLEEVSLTASKARQYASRWCHNILEWGALNRKKNIENLHYHLCKQQMIAQGLQPLTLDQAFERGHFRFLTKDDVARELIDEAADEGGS